MISEKFVDSFSDWPEKYEKNEWYFCNLREEIVNELSPEESFNSINGTIEFAKKQNDEFVIIESIELALSLIDKSGTTEFPIGLENAIDSLQKHLNETIENSDYALMRLSEVKKWYRI